ncbi:MAG: NHLP bacteriocin export ABC transporter permease/ATPase subunit [Bacteroidetes bacterium]|nr:MAG: NHLP bacteriocin export ABC transporter permease/ATPase subunit [Bacteroidota bacterium]
MHRKPTEIALGANKPFLLSKHDCVWIIASGEVEVYYAKLDSQGNIESSRNYLYSAGKGEMLFSLKSTPEVAGINLLVVSSAAKLIEIRKEFLAQLNPNQLTRKVDQWLLKVGACLQQKNAPRMYEALENTQHLLLGNKQVAYPAKGIKWAVLKKGNVAVYGEERGNVEPIEKISRGIIPVSAHLWLTAESEEVELEIVSTIEIIQDEISLMLALHYVEQHFFAKIEQRYQQARRETAQSLQNRLNLNQSMIERSLSGLKSVIKQDETQSFAAISSSNLLLAACQLIGRETGFRFDGPKFLQGEAPSLTSQLKAISQVSNVRVRKVILRGEWWKTENGHLLAFTAEDKQPVALIQQKAGSYVLKNPATKTSLKVGQDLASMLDPIAYMFFYAFDGPMTSIKKIGAFALNGLKKDMGFMMLAALCGSVLGLFTPILTGVMLDDVIPQADRGLLLEVVAIMLVIGLVSALLQLIKGILLLRVETKSNIHIQAALMDHLLRLPVAFYRRFSAGDLTLRALGINQIRQVLSNTLLTTVLSGAFSIVNLGLLFYYDFQLAWIGIGLSLLAAGFVSVIGLLKLKYDRQIARQQGDIQGFLFEFLSGIAKVRISGSEKRIFALWAQKFGFLKKLGFKSVSYENWITVFKGSYPLLTNIIFFGAIFYVMQHAIPGETSLISVGVFMAFISAFNQFLNDCLNMSYALISSLNVVPVYERLKPILEEKTESSKGSADPGELVGEIEMSGVTFRYHEDQPPVLKHISFRIRPGEMVAFVGPSGSGKSTIMRLLLGFEEPEAGSIYYDGQAFDSLNKDLVRQQIGVVLQDGALMAGSIYQNIVGNSELSLEDALAAAEMAGLEDDIKQMPMGMHTVISEGAGTFSGGQKQRLMIARAIVHKPRMLFMDEATSALDNRTQNIVTESLDRLQATRIIIAHRLSTVMHADRIYVVEAGEIVEHGTYRELMKRDGLFAKLAKRQIA